MTTTNHDVILFVSGLLSAGYAIAALYFVKFWRQSRDRLFAFFAAAFVLLLLQRLALALMPDLFADSTWYYVVRLLAFALILFAIIDKNRATDR
jgi:membrane-associated PAP2 superfamily phosphatase